QLKEKGFRCARRTVAKYRNLLNIRSAARRKIYSPYAHRGP
ncbi:MAG: hypothetical protein LLG04_13100, partial [Parachlamydia sp.]|nr:hypothetical protein [Parachlamydia sp.]